MVSWADLGKEILNINPTSAKADALGLFTCNFCDMSAAYPTTIANVYYLENHQVDCLWRRAWELFLKKEANTS